MIARQGKDIVIAGTEFQPVITAEERRRGVRYIVATALGNIKQRPMRPHIYARYK